MSYSITDFLGLENVPCTFVEENYSGRESYKVVKKRKKPVVRDTSDDR